MRLFVSVDMEGTSGVERLEEIFRGLPGYERARRLMAGDTNAVIQGAISGGANEIVVGDAHGYMCNLRPQDLIQGVLLKRGQLRRGWCQLKTLDTAFDAVILLGYHAKAGSEEAVLAHTWITSFLDVRVNGVSVPEPSLNGWVSGGLGVPVVMLSGDDKAIAESQPVLGDIGYAQVKRSTGYSSAEHLPLDEARELLRSTAKRAVESASSVAPVQCELPVTVEVDLSNDPVGAPTGHSRRDDNLRFIDRGWGDEPLSDVDLVLATHPQVQSSKPGTVAFTCGDFPTAYRTLHSILLEVYERDIERLIEDGTESDAYDRPDLDELIGDHALIEIDPAEANPY